MSKEMRLLKKNIDQLTKDDLYQLIKDIREATKIKTNMKKALEFIETLQLVLKHFSKLKDFNSERIILYQLFEIVWWARFEPKAIDILVKNISFVLLDSHPVRGVDRTNFFTDLTTFLTRFTKNKTIYQTISTAAIELIKWSSDEEILELLEVIEEKTANNPLNDAIKLLEAKVFMNTLFYLIEANHHIVMDVYRKFSSFSIDSFDMNISQESNDVSPIFGENINEILQEGVINAIINLARIDKKQESGCVDCINNIREIINDSEYLLKSNGKTIFKDIYRLSVTFDQYKLWDKFMDIPLVQELKTERDKNEKYQIAEAKSLAILKNMRIEEYDALKIGRRGIILEYDINNTDDIRRIFQHLIVQEKNSLKSLNLVAEVDALIEINDELTEHLRERGDIPADRKTVDEIQDLTTRSDDLTQAAMKESRIVEQVQFLKQLELTDDRYLINRLLHTKALLFAIGMFGFESPELNITRLELMEHVDVLCERKMIHELIDPLIRAITLRAARLDDEAVITLFRLLNSRGLKFIPRSYKQYKFIDNVMRLVSFLARQGQIKNLEKIKDEMEKANRIWIEDEDIPLKLARAINEGILSYTAKDTIKKLQLVTLVKELAKVNSYEIDVQIKYAEALNFIILDIENVTWNNISFLIDELLEFSSSFRNNQQIEEKSALGLLWSGAIAKIYKQNQKFKQIREEINLISSMHSNNRIIMEVTTLFDQL
jgi:hypothetical protein